MTEENKIELPPLTKGQIKMLKANEKLSVIFDCMPKGESKDPLDVILSRVSTTQQIPIKDMEKKTRKREIVFARQLFFYISRELLFFKKYSSTNSLAIIGEKMGKDHATVMHSCKAINNLRDTDKYLKPKIDYVLSLCDQDLRKVLNAEKCKHETVITTPGILYHCDICGETRFIPEGSEEKFHEH